jgi:hypothetical protein
VVLATMILISSVALCLFYLQVTCQYILKREFDPERLSAIANAYRLEFLFVGTEVEHASGPVDYRWVQMALRCDYMTLTYLLKSTAPSAWSGRERLLMVYFKVLSLVLSVSGAFRLSQKQTVLKQTAILKYFANMLAEQVGEVQFSALGA